MSPGSEAMLTELASGKPSAPGPGGRLCKTVNGQQSMDNSQWTLTVVVHSHSRGPGAPWPRLCSCQHPHRPHHPQCTHIKYPWRCRRRRAA